MIKSLTVAFVFLTLLVSCAETVVGPTTSAPASGRSEESLRLEQYYSGIQSRLRAQGLLRTDGGGPDVPFTTRNLIENFERIALYDEYSIRNGRFVAQQTPSRLRRWQSPIRIGIVFGDLVPAEQRTKDIAIVRSYASRLARLTGLDISLSDSKPNFHVLFLYRDEQKTIGPRLQVMVPRLSQVVVNEIRNSPRNTFCAAYAFSEHSNNSAYSSAIILIKAEHADLMRQSCVHEEMAQALGLANDSPKARPSIFNDDEEFALLTRHDELLLKMLYDRRLSLGMTPATALPILPNIARDLMGGAS